MLVTMLTAMYMMVRAAEQVRQLIRIIIFTYLSAVHLVEISFFAAFARDYEFMIKMLDRDKCDEVFIQSA